MKRPILPILLTVQLAATPVAFGAPTPKQGPSQTASAPQNGVTQKTTSLPVGGADPKLLTLAPDSAPPVETKQYSAPDGAFSLQIPQRFCVFNFTTPRGASFTDFAAAQTGGARLTLVLGTTTTFTPTDTLLGHIKEIVDGINALETNKGDSFIMEAPRQTDFRGQKAAQTGWTTVTKGVVATGQALEWQEGDRRVLAIWGAPPKSLQAMDILRNLLDTLRLEKGTPKAAETEAETLAQVEAMSVSFTASNEAIDRLSNRMQTALSALPPVTPEGRNLDLEVLDRTRLGTSPNSYERADAAKVQARAVARVAWEAIEKDDVAKATLLFERRNALETESYNAKVAALRVELAQGETELTRWARLAPQMTLAPSYDLLLNSLTQLKDMRLSALRNLAMERHDAELMDETTRPIFALRSLQFANHLLSNEPPEKRWDHYVALATCLEEMADVAQLRADLDGGRAYSARALAWRLATPEGYRYRGIVDSLRNWAVLEAALGDMRVARETYEKALTEIERLRPQREKEIAAEEDANIKELNRLDWQSTQWFVLNNLGSAVYRMGDYATGEKHLKDALAAIEKLPETGTGAWMRSVSRGATLANLAVLRADAGDLEGAASFQEQAIALYRATGNDSGLALALFNSAGLDEDRGHLDDAITKVERAQAIYAGLHQSTDLIASNIYASKLALAKGNKARAANLAQAALALARAEKSNSWRGSAARALAFARLSQRPGKGIEPPLRAELDDLVKEARDADARLAEPFAEVNTLTLQGVIAEVSGNLDSALTHYKDAITRQEQVRATMASGDQFSEKATNYAIYDSAVSLLLKLNRPDEAFDMLSRARSSKLRDSLRLSALKSNDAALQALLTRATALDEKLVKTRAQLASEQAQPAPQRDATRVKNLEQLLASTQAEFFQVSAQIKAKNPRFEEALSLSPTELKKAQKSIPEGALLLQFAPLDEGVYIFAVTNKSLKIFDAKVSRDDLNAAIRTFRGSIDRDMLRLEHGKEPQSIDDEESMLRQASEKLSKWLLTPVRAEVEAAKVVAVAPSGELFYLPFHVLGETDKAGKWRFLIEDKPVAYLAKGDVLSIAGNSHPEENGKGILAMGDPAGAELPAAKVEVETIARIFPGSSALTGAGASKAVLLQPASRDKRVVHLAAHGVLDSNKPDQSYIQLSPDGTDDGKLRVGEILGIDLSKVDLVTLSACQTALGEGKPDGTEISSLAQSFSTAGTPSVVASLWNVEDQSTARLMETFYGALADGASKGAALQKAQITLLRDPKTRHPIYWAPFELMGDWR